MRGDRIVKIGYSFGLRANFIVFMLYFSRSSSILL